jgi:hypothetical protein
MFIMYPDFFPSRIRGVKKQRIPDMDPNPMYFYPDFHLMLCPVQFEARNMAPKLKIPQRAVACKK